MQLLLGEDWLKYKEENMEYGNSSTKYTIVTFFNSKAQRMEMNRLVSTKENWDAYSNGGGVDRYKLFKFQTTASHAMPLKFRKKLLTRIKLCLGDQCLEIGCGVPKLALDMSALTQNRVLMLDIRKQIKQ